MIIIAEPYAKFDETISAGNLNDAAPRLLIFAERIILPYYRKKYDDLSIEVSVQLEQGSTKAWIRVSSIVAAMIFYGEIRQSIDTLIRDAKAVGDIILPGIPQSVGIAGVEPAVSQRRLGIPGKLHRLFEAVEHHEITADEATNLAVDFLDSDEEIKGDAHLFLGTLAKEFKRTYKLGTDSPRRRPIPRREPLAVDLLVVRRRKGLFARRKPETGKIEIEPY